MLLRMRLTVGVPIVNISSINNSSSINIKELISVFKMTLARNNVAP